MNRLVFSDGITQASTATYYSLLELNERLGRFDQLAVQIVVDNVATAAVSPTVSVALQTCCDGEHFSTKVTLIPTTGLTVGGTTVAWGGDDGSKPNATSVRFAIVIVSSTSLTARVRLFASARDQGGVQIVRHDRSYEIVAPKPGKAVPLTPNELLEKRRQADCAYSSNKKHCLKCFDDCQKAYPFNASKRDECFVTCDDLDKNHVS